MSIEIAFLLLLVLALMALPIVIRKLRGANKYILPFHLMKRIDSGEELVILDIRPPPDFEREHIDGADNISHDALAELVSEPNDSAGINKDQPVFLVCQSDLKSARTARMLEQKNFTDISVVKGGMFGWKRARLPLAKKT